MSQTHTNLAKREDETPLRIVMVGHVDHGKSTLIGRLFNDTGTLPEGKLEQIKATCERRGVPFEWAFLMDALQSERDQNITIDSAQIWFRTETRPYVIIDAPGHKEFLKNMITGAASADAAVLLIAANEGVREQSRRHGYMLSLLGIRQVAVAVNKMDMVDFSETVFNEIEAEFREFLGQIGVEPQVFIPVSARGGQNVVTKAEETPWYQGPTIVDVLDRFSLPQQDLDRPLRFPVQDVYRFDDRRILAGRIESGTIRVGDRLKFAPSGEESIVHSVERWSATDRDDATAGESVGITLEDQLFVERGHVGAHQTEAPCASNRFKANVFWMGRSPLTTQKLYKLKLATQEVECRVAEILKVIDASSLEDEGVDQTLVERNDAAELIIETKFPVAFDVHADIETTGRFVLVDGFDVAGGGIVISNEAIEGRLGRWGVDDEELDEAQLAISSVANTSRGGVLWLSGERTFVQAAAETLRRGFARRQRPAFIVDAEALTELNHDLDGASLTGEAGRRALAAARLLGKAGVAALVVADSPTRAELGRDAIQVEVRASESRGASVANGVWTLEGGHSANFTVAELAGLVDAAEDAFNANR